jgi:hypothetical protein
MAGCLVLRCHVKHVAKEIHNVVKIIVVWDMVRAITSVS